MFISQEMRLGISFCSHFHIIRAGQAGILAILYTHFDYCFYWARENVMQYGIYSGTLEIEATRSSKMSVHIYQTT
jgi:hypothetical protein